MFAFLCPVFVTAQNENKGSAVYSSEVQYTDFDEYVQIIATRKDGKGNVIAKIDDWYELSVLYDASNTNFEVSAQTKSCPITHYSGKCPKEEFNEVFLKTIDSYYGRYGSYSIYRHKKSSSQK